jgi:phage virion morphogenesis protein
MLRVKNHLYRSITHVATDRDAIIGTNRRYAALHQFGGMPGMKNAGARAVPARPYLGISSADRDEVVRILASKIRWV